MTSLIVCITLILLSKIVGLDISQDTRVIIMTLCIINDFNIMIKSIKGEK